MAKTKNNPELIKKFRTKLRKINRDLDKIQESISDLYEAQTLVELEKKLNEME
jgi:hypothetical protein